MNGTCPKCSKVVMYVNVQSLDAQAGGRSWAVVSYQCPLCNCVLAVAPDPVTLGSDLVDMIVKKLRG
jgi:hypothetical protein